MLQIGLSDELRKMAKFSSLPSPDKDLPGVDLFYCWDIRRAKMDGRNCLVVMNASTSLCGIMGNLHSNYLKRIEDLAIECIYNAVCMYFGKDIAIAYLGKALPLVLTKTHGYKAGGNLTQITYWIECWEMDPEQGFQFEAVEELNEACYIKGAAFDNGYDMLVVERFQEKLIEFGFLEHKVLERGNAGDILGHWGFAQDNGDVLECEEGEQDNGGNAAELAWIVRSKVSDFEAVKIWAHLTDSTKDELLHNVPCSKCGITSFAPGFSMHYGKYGFSIEGTCETCGGFVARYIN